MGTAIIDRRTALLGTVGFVVLAALALAWAKWIPYIDRLEVTRASGEYPGKHVLAKAGDPGSGPSLSGAWAFTKAYFVAVWPAVLAALLIAAAVKTLLPRDWLLRALGHDGLRGRATAAVASLPSMMCTCCTAPVTRSLRRAGVPTGTVLAYWLGNPVLNPAVLAFLAIVLPWEWVFTRVLIGSVLVLGITGLLARLATRDRTEADVEVPPPGPAPKRFGQSLLRMSVVLIPEYLVVVMGIGLVRGWLLPVGESWTDLALPATVVAAIAGTLVVIPTGGEIPVITALLAAGVGPGPLGALLITLPA